MKNPRKNPSTLLVSCSIRLEVVGQPKLAAAALAGISLLIRLAMYWWHHAA